MPRTKGGRLPLWPLLLAGVVLAYAAFALHHALIPFALGFALAYVANPIVNFFEVGGVRREVTVVAVYLVIAAAITLAASQILDDVTQELSMLQATIPAYLAKSKDLLAAFQEGVAARLPIGARAVRQWEPKLYAPLFEQAQNIPSYLLNVVPLLSFLFLIPFITFFLLLDGPRMISRFIQAAPSRYVEQSLHLISEIDTSLGNYLRGIIIVAGVISVASFVGLWAMGVHYALAISVLAGLSSFVPYLGAVMGAVVGGLVAGFQFGGVAAGLKVVLLFALIRLGDEAFVQPFVAKHSVHLHPLVFLLALLVGGELFGFMGLVFAVPAACILKALLRVLWTWYSSEALINVPHHVGATEVPYT